MYFMNLFKSRLYNSGDCFCVILYERKKFIFNLKINRDPLLATRADNFDDGCFKNGLRLPWFNVLCVILRNSVSHE